MPVELFTPPTSAAPRRQRIVDYPDGDGKPIAETGFHVDQLLHTLVTLEYWFRETENVYVSGNLLFYYKEGDPRSRIAPDIFVVWGVSKQMRRNYKLWKEQQAPQVVFEITSSETQKEDLGKKYGLYARLGVAEYYLFDPCGDYLDPPLRGYQLAGEDYFHRPVETLFPPRYGTIALPMSCEKQNTYSLDSSTNCWRLKSERLKLELWALPTGNPEWRFVLHSYDPATGRWLLDPGQTVFECEMLQDKTLENEARAERATKAREAAELRAAAETQARLAAEAELAKLQAELEKLRGKDKANP
jgi:Uma2 family endonuclease